MKKFLKVLTICLLVFALCFVAVGCNKDNGTNNDGNNDAGNGGSNDGGSLTITLTATEPSTTIKIGESILITNFYEIKGSSTLSAAQRACTYVSSNEDVVKINAKRAEAVGAGTATITVTSSVDNTKTCSFQVTVAKTFIDRDLSTIDSADDFSKEWDDATGTGSFRTSSGITNFYYLSDVYATQWYVETDITIHNVNWDDRWPKIGIVAQTKNSQGVETMVAFYLNASIGLNDYYDDNGTLVHGEDNLNWNEFGVSEVAQGGHWAWEEGITNSLARHHDYCWNTGDNTIAYGTTFKLGVARDGDSFHVYINGAYAGSYQLSSELDILYEDGKGLESHVGFYHFSCDATFSNYSVTTDAAAVAGKVPAEPIYCEFLED